MKGKWVFKVIYKPDGSVEKFKARWVACGYSHIQGVDYYETYCSTLATASFRMFLAAVCANDDEFIEADVVKAFTQGSMDDTELYVEQPHGFADKTKVACKLTRLLEGTKQAGNAFMISNADEMKAQLHRSIHKKEQRVEDFWN